MGFDYGTEIDETVAKINSTVKTVLITSGAIGNILMPKIHHMDNVMVVLVFCFNLEKHSKWASDFNKIKGVTKSFDEALKLANKLLSGVMKNDLVNI